MWGIHRWPVNSPHKGPVNGKCFHLMTPSYKCGGRARGRKGERLNWITMRGMHSPQMYWWRDYPSQLLQRSKWNLSLVHSRSRRDVTRLSNKRWPYLFGVATANRTKVTTPNKYGAEIIARMSDWENWSIITHCKALKHSFNWQRSDHSHILLEVETLLSLHHLSLKLSF